VFGLTCATIPIANRLSSPSDADLSIPFLTPPTTDHNAVCDQTTQFVAAHPSIHLTSRLHLQLLAAAWPEEFTRTLVVVPVKMGQRTPPLRASSSFILSPFGHLSRDDFRGALPRAGSNIGLAFISHSCSRGEKRLRAGIAAAGFAISINRRVKVVGRFNFLQPDNCAPFRRRDLSGDNPLRATWQYCSGVATGASGNN
jgi:hypothetical protein